MTKNNLGNFVKNTLKDSLVKTFEAFSNEIYDVIDNVGEKKDEYHVSILPFSIERIDGNPVPQHLLLAIKKSLSRI
jgi:hypothetical protein